MEQRPPSDLDLLQQLTASVQQNMSTTAGHGQLSLQAPAGVMPPQTPSALLGNDLLQQLCTLLSASQPGESACFVMSSHGSYRASAPRGVADGYRNIVLGACGAQTSLGCPALRVTSTLPRAFIGCGCCVLELRSRSAK